MMTLLKRLLVATFLLTPAVSQAQSGPVVLELFTSQGCSSCPPADAYLADLLDRDDVLPLAFHVDYWDRLGWKDTFASPEFTARQYAYGKAFQNRSVWTPQFVVAGVDYSKGSFRNEVKKFIKDAANKPAQVGLRAGIQGQKVVINAEALANGLPKMIISIVGYSHKETVKIKRGENAGRTITYHNTVNSWETVAAWNGRGSKSFSAALKISPPMAVIVQAENNGPILAAAKLQ